MNKLLKIIQNNNRRESMLRARVSAEEMQDIKQFCQSRNITTSNLIRHALNSYLVKTSQDLGMEADETSS
jgi:hypothetical protein